MRLVRLLVTLLIMFDTAPVVAQEQVYRWVDKRGVIHYTDDPEQLPEPQRSEALRKLDTSRYRKKPAATKSAPAGSSLPRPGQRQLPPGPADKGNPLPATESLELDNSGRAQQIDPRDNWKRILATARSRIDQLEKDCRRYQQDRNHSRRQALLFARPGARKQTNISSGLLQKCRKQLATARQRYEKLKERARRQGMPRQIWDQNQ